MYDYLAVRNLPRFLFTFVTIDCFYFRITISQYLGLSIRLQNILSSTIIPSLKTYFLVRPITIALEHQLEHVVNLFTPLRPGIICIEGN